MFNTIKTSLISAAILILSFSHGPSWSEPAKLEAEAQASHDAATEAAVKPGLADSNRTTQENQPTQKTPTEPNMDSGSMAQFEVTPESQTTREVEVKPNVANKDSAAPTSVETPQPPSEPQAQTQSLSEAAPEFEPRVTQEPKTQPGAKQETVLEPAPVWQYWSPWASRYQYRQYLDELRDERRELMRARTEALRERRDRYRSARRWWHNPWAESRRRWWDARSDYSRDLSEQRYGYRRTQRDTTRDYRDSFAGPGAWGPYGVYGDPWSYAPSTWGPYPW